MTQSNTKRKNGSYFSSNQASKRARTQQQYSSGSSGEESEGIISRNAPKSILKGSNESENNTNSKAKASSVPKDSAIESEALDVQHESDDETAATESNAQESASDEDSDEDTGASSDDSEVQNGTRKKTKRHDPDVFANSMATILSSKLSSSKRDDPVLARSKDAQAGRLEQAESKLEAKAERSLRDEKRQAKDKGRVRDVLLGDAAAISQQANGELAESVSSTAAAIAEQEKRLRKTATSGVVKLFNAVRAAQVRSEEAARAMRENGVVGQHKREEKIGEMGRQAFLDMVSKGG